MRTVKKYIGKILVATALVFGALGVADAKGTYAEEEEKTAVVYNFEELESAFLDSNVSTIYVGADIDVPCGNNDFDSSYKSKSAALVADRNLVIEGLNGESYTLNRYVANDVDDKDKCRSIIEVYGNGNYDEIQVSIKNLVLDGGAVWNTDSLSDIRNSSKDGRCWSTNDGYAGRAIIDVANKGTINLEYGCVLRNSQVSVNSQTRKAVGFSGGGSSSYGAGIRIEYSDSFGGGTANLKMGAVIEGCSSVNWGGAIGAYNYGRLNIYGGTIRRCTSNTGAAICCTYRSATSPATVSVMKMYGGTIEDCDSGSTGVINIDGKNSISSEFTGGIIRNCAGYAINVTESAKLDIADYDGENIQISGVSEGNLEINSYKTEHGIRYSDINNITFVDSYIILFTDGNNTLGNISIKKNTASGASFPANPVKNGYAFDGWLTDDGTRVDADTVIAKNYVLNANWINLHVHGDITYTADDNFITATCNQTEYAENCEHKNVSVRFSEVYDTTYNPGNSVGATLAYSPSEKAWNSMANIGSKSDISYEKLNASGAWVNMGAKAPVNAGTYRACITIGEYTIYSNQYTINPRPVSELVFSQPEVEAGLFLPTSDALNIKETDEYLANIVWYLGENKCANKVVCGFNKEYKAVISFKAGENYCFDSSVAIDGDWSIDDIDGKNMSISKTYRTKRANIYSVKAEENIKLTSVEAYPKNTIKLLAKSLECEVDEVKTTGGIEKVTKSLPVEWNLIGALSENEILYDEYNQEPDGINVFSWNIIDKNDIYDITDENGTGKVNVKNGSHIHSYTKKITKATTTKNGSIQEVCSCGAISGSKKVIYYPKTITLSATSFAYDGKEHKPTVTVKDAAGTALKLGTDYTVSYLDVNGKTVTPKTVGSYTVKITMKGNYSGSISKTYKIVPKKTTIGTPANASDGIMVKWTKNTSGSGYYIYRSVNGADYTKVKTITSNATVSWKDTGAKTNGAKYQYKIVAYKTVNGTTFRSGYSSVKTIYFVSRPTISSLTNSAASKMTVKWGKNSKGTGYQIQYGLKSDFSDAKSVSVTSNTTVTKTIGSLTKGKTYYVRIRSYKLVNDVKYFSQWSTKMSVKITK